MARGHKYSTVVSRTNLSMLEKKHTCHEDKAKDRWCQIHFKLQDNHYNMK